MKVYNEIINILEKEKVSYTPLEHEHVHTSEDAAKIRGNTIEQAAKAIVLKAKDKEKKIYFQCVLGGDKKIDFKKIRGIIKIKNISLANAEEVLEVTGCSVGSVPPFGFLFNLNVYFDRKLLEQEEIVFSAGTHNNSVRMKSEDYVKVVKPVIEEISMN
jgi:Ala-tRNA(Pro) deacylase